MEDNRHWLPGKGECDILAAGAQRVQAFHASNCTCAHTIQSFQITSIYPGTYSHVINVDL